jgi:maltooligosyltrehalose trehalohydrolase
MRGMGARMVDACHGRGLSVLLDVVYNHLGPEGNHLGRFGPYFTRRYGTPWGEAVNLDGRGSEEVRRFFIENALMWLADYRVDGLRLDAVHALFDRSALHFLEELEEAARSLEARTGRHLLLIAESDLNDPRVVAPREAGGWGMDAQWSDDFHHALHALLTGERDGYYGDFGSLVDLRAALERGFVYDGRHSAYRGRRHGRPLREPRGRKLLGYLQNHDQVGNRALGERIGRLTSPGRLRIGAALVLTAPFVPLLFQGEEWGASSPFLYFTDMADPELGRAVRDGRRREFAGFGWKPEEIPDPQDEATFRRSRLDWDERTSSPHRELLGWYRRLVRLRREHPDLLDDRMPRVRADPDAGWLAMERGSLTVACNVGPETRRVPLEAGGVAEVLVAFPEGLAPEGRELELPPDSVVIVERRGEVRPVGISAGG